MLLVNARVGPRLIHGNGLIAQQFIARGTRVSEFRPELDVLIPDAVFQSLPASTQEQVYYWSYCHAATGTYVMSSDDDRFTNHSPAPNTKVAGNYTVAVCDIHPGEEITNDYEELHLLDFLPSGGS